MNGRDKKGSESKGGKWKRIDRKGKTEGKEWEEKGTEGKRKEVK